MRFLFSVLLIGLVCGCSSGPVLDVPLSDRNGGPRAGALTGLTPIAHYAATPNRVLLWLGGIRGQRFDHAIDCYRMSYWSLDADGKPIPASALLALPHGAAPRGLVSWQHGTSTSREEVPSRLNLEGKMAARIFSGLGYALIAPDYQGLGDSPGVHPYLVAETAANDVLYARRAAASILDKSLATTLIGFSQGGHATLAALRAIEKDVFEEKEDPFTGPLAAIAVAGPYSLRRISFPTAMIGQAKTDPLYLAYMTRGYASAYGEATDSVLSKDQVAIVERLLDGSEKPGRVIEGLPENPRALFSNDFLAAYDRDRPNWLLDALAANEVSHWRPRSRVLLLYGEEDVDVPPVEALTTAREMSDAGADVTARSVGRFDHAQSAFKSIPTILDWLQETTPSVDPQSAGATPVAR
jgi:pimeloyl-ACP methyl ester carboxylesterase